MAWLYAITPAGRERFLEWLQPPFRSDVVCVPPDPLRTRVHFLGLLSARDRARMLGQAIASSLDHLAILKPRAEDRADDLRALKGAVLAIRARIEWLSSLHREVQGASGAPDPSVRAGRTLNAHYTSPSSRSRRK